MPSTKQFNIHEAKTNFSRLIDEVSNGEEIVIAKAGKPIAKLVRIEAAVPLRRPGFLKGKIRVSEDFDAPLPTEMLDAFDGS